MDSPETTKPALPPAAAAAASNAAAASPTVVQDSPFSTYVSNLSPIKPVNNVQAASAFRELSFPPPSPVFTSPHANPTRKVNLLKRSQCFPPDSGKFNLDYSGSIKETPENTLLFGSHASMSLATLAPRIMKDSECEFPMQFQSCSSPSGCVDEFLADPMEDCVDSSSPSNLCLDEAAQPHQHSQDRYATSNENPKECEQSQYCHPSGCVNEIQANQVECGSATVSADIFSVCELSQDAKTGNNISKEIIVNPDHHNVKEGGVKAEGHMEDLLGKMEDSVGCADEGCRNDCRSLSQCSEPLFCGANDLMKNVKCEAIDVDEPGYQNSVDQDRNGESSIVPKNVKSDTVDQREERIYYSMDRSHYVEQLSAENGKGVDLDCTPMMHAESANIVPLDNSHDLNSRASCNTSADNVVSHERGGLRSKLQPEGCQHLRAMRKRLEFDSAGISKMAPECNGKPWNARSVVSKMEINSGPKLRNLSESPAESVGASKNMKVSVTVNLSGHALSGSSLSHPNLKAQAHADMVDRSIRNNMCTITAPRPSGIGLHLNSIVNVVTINCHINVQSEKDLEKDNLSSSGEMAFRQNTHQRIYDSKVCLASMASATHVNKVVDSNPLVHTISGTVDDNQQGNQAMTLPSSSVSLPSQMKMDSLKSSLQSKFLDCCIAPCNMKGPPPEDACESEELNEMSPRKRRKKVPEDVGCKRCNCKKSKCLKLYCDCFAAGVYCAEACACQGCFNKQEFEDTVLETRQQIENRNPLAFAPKVVGCSADASKIGGEESKCLNATSARHKRGCNCKRSQCLKKYCECFQAKVGCSFGCRCEGCKNTYGKRDGVEIVETEHIKTKDGRCENNQSDGTDVVVIRNEMMNKDKHLPCLSPFTPLQEGCKGGNVSKFQYAARRHLSSPESDASALFSYGKSQSSPSNSGNASRFRKMREGNSEQCADLGELEVHDGSEVDQFSPRWERLAERCNLRLLPSSSPSDPREQTESLQATLFQGSGHPSVGSLLWHSSPVTPIPQFGESRLPLKSCSDGEPLNTHEDDTPDILKDACVPNKRLKMSSPNKKRVSPPHKHLNEIVSSSSASTRSRKFILKSVPSFPSLTPYGNNITGHGT